jgi:hypothetical protein
LVREPIRKSIERWRGQALLANDARACSAPHLRDELVSVSDRFAVNTVARHDGLDHLGVAASGSEDQDAKLPTLNRWHRKE